MDTGMLLAIGAGATFLLALAAFWSIWQNHSLQIRERRERLLSEIIEWAIDVAKCEATVDIQEPSPIISKLNEKTFLEYGLEDKKKLVQGIMQDHQRVWLSRYMNLHRNYQTLDVRGEYILSLSNIKDFKSIYNSIHDLKTQICNYLDILWRYMEDMKNESKKDTVNKKAKDLNDKAIQVIREATKIKTRDIG